MRDREGTTYPVTNFSSLPPLTEKKKTILSVSESPPKPLSLDADSIVQAHTYTRQAMFAKTEIKRRGLYEPSPTT